jgi:hypothetical protein
MNKTIANKLNLKGSMHPSTQQSKIEIGLSYLFISKNHISVQQLGFICRFTKVPESRDAYANAMMAVSNHKVGKEHFSHLQIQESYPSCENSNQ